MKIGILGPSHDEIQAFFPKLSDSTESKAAMLTVYEGRFAGLDIAACVCGICKVNMAIAAQVLIDRYQVTHLVVTGTSGGIDPALRIGDTVIADKIWHHDVADGILTRYHPWMQAPCFSADPFLLDVFRAGLAGTPYEARTFYGSVATGEQFITQQGRAEIIERCHPLCVDMETAAAAHVGYVNGVPFAAIRTVTDTEEHSGVETFDMNLESAAERSLSVLELFLNELAKHAGA